MVLLHSERPSSGNTIVDALVHSQLLLLNTDNPTHLLTNCRPSSPDLSLASIHLYLQTEWTSLNSDHLPRLAPSPKKGAQIWGLSMIILRSFSGLHFPPPSPETSPQQLLTTPDKLGSTRLNPSNHVRTLLDSGLC